MIDALFILSCCAHARGLSALAGALVGLCVLIKPQLGLFLLWALAHRVWPFAIGWLVVVAIGYIASAILYGPRWPFDFANVMAYIGAHGEAFAPNQSVNGLVNRLLGNGDAITWHEHDFAPYNPVVHASSLLAASDIRCVRRGVWPAIDCRPWQPVRNDRGGRLLYHVLASGMGPSLGLGATGILFLIRCIDLARARLSGRPPALVGGVGDRVFFARQRNRAVESICRHVAVPALVVHVLRRCSRHNYDWVVGPASMAKCQPSGLARAFANWSRPILEGSRGPSNVVGCPRRRGQSWQIQPRVLVPRGFVPDESGGTVARRKLRPDHYLEAIGTLGAKDNDNQAGYGRGRQSIPECWTEFDRPSDHIAWELRPMSRIGSERIGIDIGSKLRLEEAIGWAARSGVRIIRRPA